MNEKNSLGLNKCFKDTNNPIELFDDWFSEAKTKEPNDPNALSLDTCDKNGISSVRMVLLKDFNNDGFVFYTNLNSNKSEAIKQNANISMCFHWKSLLRQVRIQGYAEQVTDKEADEYYSTRAYDSRIGAWASNQSSILNSRDELFKSIMNYKSKFPDENNVPRPKHWTGWRLKPNNIEFWLDGKNRIHERLKYIKTETVWNKVLLSP